MIFNIYFKNKKPIILDKKLDIFDQKFFNISIYLRNFYFSNLKGFEVNSQYNESIILFPESNSHFSFYFYDSSLAFYSNGRRLKTCLDFPSNQPRSLFQMFKSSRLSASYDVYFNDRKYRPICPLAFSNTQILGLFSFKMLSNTFYKTNIPTFLELSENITQINSTISSLLLMDTVDLS